MAATETGKIVTEAEIQAALAEAEASSAIPSLDEGAVEFVPVPAGPEMRPMPREPLPVSAPPPAPAPAPAAAAAPVKEGVAGGKPAEAPPANANAPGLLYRLLDSVLTAVHWPFPWLGDRGRRWLALVGGVTLAMSVVAMVVLPLAFPRRNAVSALRDRVNQVQAGKLRASAGGVGKDKHADGGGDQAKAGDKPKGTGAEKPKR